MIPDRRKRTAVWGIGMVFIMLFMTQADAVTERRYTNGHLYPIVRHLNVGIREGWLPTVSSGPNRFSIPIPDRREPLQVELTLPVIQLRLPGLYARMSLQSLRFRHFHLGFDGERQAVHLRIRFQNQRNGVVGYYRVGPVRRRLRLHVKNAELNLYLRPMLHDGQLQFAPLDAELSFYEGNIPGFVRPLLLRTIDDAVEESEVHLQEQLDAHLPVLRSVIAAEVAPIGSIKGIRFGDGVALLALP